MLVTTAMDIQDLNQYLRHNTQIILLNDDRSHLLFQSREVDDNRDGKSDALYLDLEFPLNPTENVHRFQLILFFEYKLKVSY